MIYTVGHYKSYHQYLNEPSSHLKLAGGSCWQCIEDAEKILKYCPEGYAVFGLNAEWRVDTKPSKNGDWDDLLVDSEIIDINGKEKEITNT